MEISEYINNTYIRNLADYLHNRQNNSYKPQYWEDAQSGKQLLQTILRNEKDLTENKYYNPKNPINYYYSALSALPIGLYDFLIKRYTGQGETDKYKHAYINCHLAQHGAGAYDLIEFLSGQREKMDVQSGNNTQDASDADNYANRIGRYLGSKYPNGDCNEMVGKYIQRLWK